MQFDIHKLIAINRVIRGPISFTREIDNLLLFFLPSLPFFPPCFIAIDPPNHSAVELPGDSCKLFANCDRFRGLGTQSRKIKANFAPFTISKANYTFRAESETRNVISWRDECSKGKEEISNLEYLNGRVNLVEFVVVSMNFARIRITIHGRVAKEP